MNYDPSDWYWFVAGDTSKAWSSSAAAFVDATDTTFVAWLDAGGMPTNIDTIDNLGDVLMAQYANGAPPSTAKNTAQRDALMEAANAATSGMSDAFIAGLLDAEDAASFKTWAAYKLALSKIDVTQSSPAWPAVPAA